MLDLEERKKQEIKRMIGLLEQIDLPDIISLTEAANTLLARKRVSEEMKTA